MSGNEFFVRLYPICLFVKAYRKRYAKLRHKGQNDNYDHDDANYNGTLTESPLIHNPKFHIISSNIYPQTSLITQNYPAKSASLGTRPANIEHQQEKKLAKVC
jgi:hypothetical protein